MQPVATMSDVIAAIDRLETKLTTRLDAMERAFDQHRENLPEMYMPRRELAAILDGIKDQNAANAVRITALEGHVGSLQKDTDTLSITLAKDVASSRLQAVQENNATAREATSLTNALREHFDARTIAMYSLLAIVLLQILLSSFGIPLHVSVKP